MSDEPRPSRTPPSVERLTALADRLAGRIGRVEAVLAAPVMSDWALRYWRDPATHPKVAVTLEDYRDRVRAALDADLFAPRQWCTDCGWVEPERANDHDRWHDRIGVFPPLTD
jgi:hypothetical protein